MNLIALVASVAVASLGLAAGGTAGALLATEMTGADAAAGLPLGVHVVGSALGAVLISKVSSRTGRLVGLVTGYTLGAAGAVVVTVAAVMASFGLVLAGSTVLGVSNAAVFLTRYAATDVAGPGARGKALGAVLFGAAVGAVASPNLLGVSGLAAEALRLPRLTGLYLVAAPAFLLAGAILLAVRKPADGTAATHPADPQGRPTASSTTQRPWAALTVLAMTNLVMVAVMAIAPVHLMAHGHGLGLVGGTVSLHVLCMFAPAPLSGLLVDRVGAAPVAWLGAALLASAGVTGAIVSANEAVAFIVVLAILGLGWNAGMVAGSAMLVASVPPEARLRTEGIGEVAMGLAAGAGAPIAGVVVAVGGFGALAVSAAVGTILIVTPWLRAFALRKREGSPHLAKVRHDYLEKCSELR